MNPRAKVFLKGLHARQCPPPYMVWPEARIQKRFPDELASVAPLAMRYARALGNACSFLPCRVSLPQATIAPGAHASIRRSFVQRSGRAMVVGHKVSC